MLRLFKALIVVFLAPFALAAVYTWWIAANRKGMSDAELIHSVMHTQPGKSLYSLCNLVLYLFVVPVNMTQAAMRRRHITTYQLGPLPPSEFDELMGIIGKHDFAKKGDKHVSF